MGDAQLGAHQIAFQLFFFLALVLDAVAIAGQVIVGRMLGARRRRRCVRTRRVRMIAWSVVVGAVLRARARCALADVRAARVHAATTPCCTRRRSLWPFFALMQPLGGAVFALDGILIGASDTRYLMWSMLAASARLHRARGASRTRSAGASSASGSRSTC